MTHLYEEIRDFIKIHYYLSNRRDSQFWRDNTDLSSLPDGLADLLVRWDYRPPHQIDFPNRVSLFTEHHWLYVMLGMGWKPKSVDAFAFSVPSGHGKALLERTSQAARRSIMVLPDHRAYFASHDFKASA